MNGTRTDSGLALVARGTRVIVITCGLIVFVIASGLRLAEVIGAGVTVVAVCQDTWLTICILAVVANCAGISVIAGEALVGSYDATLARLGIAGRGLAGTVRFRATDNCFSVDFAFVRLLLSIAVKGAIARITIFKCGTIGIGQAVAVKCITIAFTVLAVVGNCAWVIVITQLAIIQRLASTKAVATVIGARIVVIAVDWQTDTGAIFTVVPDCTTVFISAFTLRQRVRETAIDAKTGISGAGIAVVA